MGPIGLPEMIFIGLLALLIFGPRKLPELGRTVGKALAEFRKASYDLRHTFEEEMREAERQADEAGREISEAARLDENSNGPPPERLGPDNAIGAPVPQSGTAEIPADKEKPADGDVKPV